MAEKQAMPEHELKCWPQFFHAIARGEKRHDLRRADRNFCVGDVVLLREFEPLQQSYTGREQRVTITYITSAGHPCALSDISLGEGFCILSIANEAAILAAELRGREQQKEADARKAEERAAYLRRNEMYPAFGLNSQAAALDDIAASIRL